MHHPDRTLLALYLAQGRIDLAATREELGWRPVVGLGESLAASFPGRRT